jgi:two-component system LytT family response regulator
MREKLRIVIADDERPARAILLSLLRGIDDVEVVGEAADGAEALEVIERTKPDLVLLDLQMPEVDGLSVVRLLKKSTMPMIAFVTAYDEYAVRAFEVNAVDYLLKPVDESRLRETIQRALDRLDSDDARTAARQAVTMAAASFDTGAPLRRIPVRKKEEIVFVGVEEIASVVANGELLYLTTRRGEKHTISYRLKDLEARLDPSAFVRLSRGTLASIEAITRVLPMPGGMYRVELSNGQQLQVSRFHSRLLRERLLKL